VTRSVLVDNIYRYTLAGTEVSALLGRMPSAVGSATLAEEMGRLQSGSRRPKWARSASRPSTQCETGRRFDRHLHDHLCSLDSTVVLSATSRFLGGQRWTLGLNQPSAVTCCGRRDHYNTARAVQGTLQRATKNCAHHLRFWVWTGWPLNKLAVAVRYAQSAFPVTAVPRRSVYRLSRQYVSLAEVHSRLQDDLWLAV
jgi:hypothetical protein